VVAALDQLRELDLLLRGQQRPLRGLVQEELQRVGRRDGQVAVDVRRLCLLLRLSAGAVVGEVDVPVVELLVEVGQLPLVELMLLNELAELREVQTPLLLALGEQRVDLVACHSRSLFSPKTGQINPHIRAVLGQG